KATIHGMPPYRIPNPRPIFSTTEPLKPNTAWPHVHTEICEHPGVLTERFGSHTFREKLSRGGIMAKRKAARSTRRPAPSAQEPCQCEAMFRASDDVRKGFILGIEKFDIKPVEYSVIDGIAIFEGDIALG